MQMVEYVIRVGGNEIEIVYHKQKSFSSTHGIMWLQYSNYFSANSMFILIK